MSSVDMCVMAHTALEVLEESTHLFLDEKTSCY